MKKLKKTFITIFKVAFGLVILLLITGIIFINTAPQFGEMPKGKSLETIKKSPNFKDGIFVNQTLTEVGELSDVLGTLPGLFTTKNLTPDFILPTKYSTDTKNINDSSCFITWYGHSAFLIEIEAKRILIDPMLSSSTSPLGFGAQRFKCDAEIPIKSLKNIDAIIISHDHYDHLDYKTIITLDANTQHFFCPLGVGSHLRKWGVAPNKITELDWWENAQFENITFTACPARHFSGRGILDRNTTLWASWAIKGNNSNLYFSGDGGYSNHFKEIGQRLGKFDLAMTECGQYNTAWKDIHMLPEESVKAGVEVDAKVLMPIHWGAFQLSTHSWTEPMERFKKSAHQFDIEVIHPMIGERANIKKIKHYQKEWWKSK